VRLEKTIASNRRRQLASFIEWHLRCRFALAIALVARVCRAAAWRLQIILRRSVRRMTTMIDLIPLIECRSIWHEALMRVNRSEKAGRIIN
jgi:hypothetical protein